MVQAKLKLKPLEDDELTAHAEVTSGNWDLQSDRASCWDFRKKSRVVMGGTGKKSIPVNGNSCSFLPPASSVYGLFLNLCALLNLELPSHTTHLTHHCKEEQWVWLWGALFLVLLMSTGSHNIKLISCPGLSKCLFFLLRQIPLQGNSLKISCLAVFKAFSLAYI